MLVEIFAAGPLETNAIIVGCKETKIGAIFDAPFGSAERILKKCEEIPLTIQAIYLTHSHWDHIGNCAILKSKLEVPIYIHALDVENLKRPGSDGLPLMIPVQETEPDGFLHEKDQIQIGELSLEVIHTPGHSPGSVCFYEPNKKVLISGDTLFKGCMGSTQLPTSDSSKMILSLEKLSQLPDETIVLPGHGGRSTIGEEKWIKRAKDFLR